MVKVRALAIRPAIPPYHLIRKSEEEEEEEEAGVIEEPPLEQERQAENDESKLEEKSPDGAVNEVDMEEPKDETDWEEAIESLSVCKMPTEHSRWQLSEWQRFCPVQLYNGILEYGKVPFACG